MKNHPYLFENGSWEAQGTFYDSDGGSVPVKGTSVVLLEGRACSMKGKMRLLSDKPVEFANEYSFEPFQEGRAYTSWTSFNRDLGKLRGTFVVISDTILSAFESEDGRHSGSECLRMIDQDTYENRGALFKGQRFVSAWSVTLKRKSI